MFRISTRSGLIATVAAGALLAASPVSLRFAGGVPAFAPAYGFAKDGGKSDDGGDRGDDSGSDRSGEDGDHGGGKSGGDGGSSGKSGGGSDNSGGSGKSGDDSNDDSSGHGGSGGGSSNDDHAGSDDHGGSDDKGGSKGGNQSATGKSEASRGGIEIVNRDGSKEEVRNGRYERKDTSGRTVEERPATSADLSRLTAASASPKAGTASKIFVGSVSNVEARGGNVEVVYSTGWKEELQNGRYELKDPNNNTVVERPAKQSDLDRLGAVAGN